MVDEERDETAKSGKRRDLTFAEYMSLRSLIDEDGTVDVDDDGDDDDRDLALDPDAFAVGWMTGVAEASARLIGVVAAELGHDHPLVDRMLYRIGSIVGEDRES
jgi:hypothetical protein